VKIQNIREGREKEEVFIRLLYNIVANIIIIKYTKFSKFSIDKFSKTYLKYFNID
jgi:hypothetical protein